MSEDRVEDYLISGKVPYLNNGLRSGLRYISDSYTYASLTQINPSGMDPYDYLYFAKEDVSLGSEHGAINATGNAKRAIHLTIDSLLELVGLKKAYGRSNFPEKLKVVEVIDAFPTRILQELNSIRNIVEHDYEPIDANQAQLLVEVAELLLLASYPILKHMAIGIYVGLKQDDRFFKWMVDHKTSTINIYTISNSAFVPTDDGNIYYGFTNTESVLLKGIELKKDNINEWAMYLNTMMYFTKKMLIPTNPPFDQNDFKRLMLFSKTTHSLEDEYSEMLVELTKDSKA